MPLNKETKPSLLVNVNLSVLIYLLINLSRLISIYLSIYLSIWRVSIQEYLTLVPGYGKRNKNRRPMDSIKNVVWSSVKFPEFDKHLKMARGHIGRNVVEITIKMKTIVRKHFMIKIIKACLRNLDNYYLSIYLSITVYFYGMNSHPPTYRLISTTVVFSTRINLALVTYQDWYAIKQRNRTKPIQIPIK